MAGVKAQKAKKTMAKASAKKTTRTVKGRNKVAKPSRTDKKKGAVARSKRTAGTTKSQSD